MIKRPQLILVIGTPGTGKTTLSRAIAREFACPRIEKDYISDPLRELNLTGPEHRVMTYRIIDNFAVGMLTECGRVIIEAPLKRDLREWNHETEHPFASYARMATSHKGTLAIVHAHCHPDVVHARITKRGHPRDDDKIASPEAFQRFLKIEPIALIPIACAGYEVLDLDTEQDDAIETAIAWLRQEALGKSRLGKDDPRPVTKGK